MSIQPMKSSLPSTARSTNSLLGSAEIVDSDDHEAALLDDDLVLALERADHGVCRERALLAIVEVDRRVLRLALDHDEPADLHLAEAAGPRARRGRRCALADARSGSDRRRCLEALDLGLEDADRLLDLRLVGAPSDPRRGTSCRPRPPSRRRRIRVFLPFMCKAAPSVVEELRELPRVDTRPGNPAQPRRTCQPDSRVCAWSKAACAFFSASASWASAGQRRDAQIAAKTTNNTRDFIVSPRRSATYHGPYCAHETRRRT